MESITNVNVLVIGSTGRVGSNICNVLTAEGYKVFGTTRRASSAYLEAKGVTSIKFQFGNADSAEAALRTSGAKWVFFLTDYFIAAGRKKDVEIMHGKVIIDACVKVSGTKHVIFNSVADADKCPDAVEHFKSKLDIEAYLKASGLSFSILRPVAFFENFDDPNNYNPLKEGSVKCLWPADVKVKLISCKDIAKAAAVMFKEPAFWSGKTLDCVSCNCDGKDVAEALTQASGTKSVYSLGIPRLVVRLFMKDLEAMITYFEASGYSSSIAAFKEVVPDAMGPREWFESKGSWANGKAFHPLAPGAIPIDTPSKSNMMVPLVVAAVAVTVGVYFAYGRNS